MSGTNPSLFSPDPAGRASPAAGQTAGSVESSPPAGWQLPVRREIDPGPPLPQLLVVGRVRLPADVRDGAGLAAAAWQSVLSFADGDREAAEHLCRLSRLGTGFDLVLVGPRLAGEGDPWQFASRLRQARPWQEWALVAAAGQVTPRAERYALTLGAAGVFDGEREFDRLLELAELARRRRDR